MSVTDIPASSTPKKRALLNLWSVGAVVIATIVLLPIVSVIFLAMFPKENIWPHLISTTLPRYLITTGILMTGVGALTAVMGTGAAWMVTRYDFPLRKWLQWVLLLPLAIPAYVGAYALVDLLEYAGPVQTAMRSVFGWQTARDYWFPEIRSMGAAILVLSASLYPYVYLLTRAAFREQSGSAEEVARSLGAGPFKRFLRVGLPLARPAIAAGVAVVMMETVNDFGTVDYFAVQTLTTGIFSVWLQSGNAGGAAQIACVVLSLIVILVMLERYSRRRMRFFNLSSRHRAPELVTLRGHRAVLATAACALPFLLGFVLPAGVILNHALANAEEWADPKLVRATVNTLTVGGTAAVLTVLGGVFMVYGVRIGRRRLPRVLMPVTGIGYAAPGAVLGVGILIPLAVLDHGLADLVENTTGIDIGLILTGSAFALVLAYTVRFFAIAQGAADAAMGRVSPNLELVSRSLGKNQGQTLRWVYFPMIRASVASALLLVFVDCVKELPATLLLRPFNYETLATRVHEQASLENLGGAAPAAVLVILVGLCAVGLLARANR